MAYPQAASNTPAFQARPETRINGLMDERDKLQAILRERIATLEGRLNPILVDTKEFADKQPPTKGTPREKSYRHGDNLQAANHDLEQMIHWIEQIEGRLEL